MDGIRNDNEALGIWMKIVLLVLLLGSGSAAISPAQLSSPEQTRAYGEAITAEGFRVIITERQGLPPRPPRSLPPPWRWRGP